MNTFITTEDLRTALDRINEAYDLIRPVTTGDQRIDALLTKALKILHEAGNRTQNIIVADEEEL